MSDWLWTFLKDELLRWSLDSYIPIRSKIKAKIKLDMLILVCEWVKIFISWAYWLGRGCGARPYFRNGPKYHIRGRFFFSNGFLNSNCISNFSIRTNFLWLILVIRIFSSSLVVNLCNISSFIVIIANLSTISYKFAQVEPFFSHAWITFKLYDK